MLLEVTEEEEERDEDDGNSNGFGYDDRGIGRERETRRKVIKMSLIWRSDNNELYIASIEWRITMRIWIFCEMR